MKYYKVEKIGKGNPVVGVVASIHGDETCGLQVLDELRRYENEINGTLYLITANLPAIDANKRFIEANLNRVFPGKKDGCLEERIAFGLCSVLKECDYVLDIHSTSYKTEPFAISTCDTEKQYLLSSYTNLKKYVIMTEKVANGKSLIDYVNDNNGFGLSFEAGTHLTEEAKENAIAITLNFLANLGLIDLDFQKSNPKKYYVIDALKSPSIAFQSVDLTNFSLCKNKQIIGYDSNILLIANRNFYPILFTPELIERDICLVGLNEAMMDGEENGSILR